MKRLFITTVCAVVFASTSFAAPSNDLFDNAQDISSQLNGGTGFREPNGNLTGSTRGPQSEPDSSTDDYTVWYSFTPKVPGKLTVSVAFPLDNTNHQGDLYIGAAGAPDMTSTLSELWWSWTKQMDAYNEQPQSISVSGGQKVYIRLGARSETTFDFQASFKPNPPVIAFWSSGVLGSRKKIYGAIYNFSRVTNVAVSGGAYGQASGKSYNSSNGSFSFVHTRRGKFRHGVTKRVTYTITAYSGATRLSSGSKSFKVRY